MKNLKLFIGLLAGSVAYCYLMWYQKLGINAVIFAVLLITSILYYKKEIRHNRTLLSLACLFFLASVSVAVNGIIFAKVMYYLSLFTFLSFVQAPSVRLLFSGYISFFTNLPRSFKRCFEMIKEAFAYPFVKNEKGKKRISKRNVKAFFIRIGTAGFIVLVFLSIFISANVKFRNMWIELFNPIADFLSMIWNRVSFFDTFHFLFVLYFLSLFFLSFKPNCIVKHDLFREDNFKRKKKRLCENGLSVKLKDEYKTALLSIVLVNLLLLFVNITDLFSVWSGQIPETAAELSFFVHNGTYLLILSVLISIGIILYFFRDNLNLFRKNKKLKIAAYVWIFQNAFLLLSVGLRNIHYISECGLTYKRIGVFIFLLVTCISLVFLFLKIKEKKTFYYYARTCAWGVFSILIFSGFFNWDIMIGKYNTTYVIGNVDYEYIENLSNQVSPYLYSDKNNYPDYVKNYISEVENQDWQSFNWCDFRAVNKLK